MKVVEMLSYDDVSALEVGESVELELADETRLLAGRSNISQYGMKTRKSFSVKKSKDAGDKCIVTITRNS